MSLESRLSSLQSSVEELLLITKAGSSNPSNNNEEVTDLPPILELRSIELWKSAISECLGTLLYVFIVCGASIPWTGHFPPFISVAIASSLAYYSLVKSVFSRAHLNPAFTAANYVSGRLTGLRCCLYLVAQCGGAIAGGAVLYGLTVPGYQGTLGATTIAANIEPLQAFGIELVLTFALVLTYLSEGSGGGAATALMLLAGQLVAIPSTGGSLNPARSLAPSFVMNKWPRHWVFWLGPLLGGLGGGYLNRYILQKKRSKEEFEDSVSVDVPEIVCGEGNNGGGRLVQRGGGPDAPFSENRLEPIYGGTRSLYMRPSPPIPRNLNRSQSVYTSKRYGDNPKLLDAIATPGVGRRKATAAAANTPQQQQNYEPIYDRNTSSVAMTTHLASAKGGLLVVPSNHLSGPPSYESNYFKTYSVHSDNAQSMGRGGGPGVGAAVCHSNGGHHNNGREKSLDSRERETNRILAQYEISMATPPPPTTLKSNQIKSPLGNHDNKNLYPPPPPPSDGMRRQNLINYKETHPEKGEPLPPPRFRAPIQIPVEEGPLKQGRFRYQESRDYPPRVLAAEKDENYSRVVLEPLMGAGKTACQQQHNHHGNNHSHQSSNTNGGYQGYLPLPLHSSSLGSPMHHQQIQDLATFSYH